MHEYSIASEIAKNVLDAAEKQDGKRVLSVQLDIGELTLLNMEQVTTWIHELFKGTIAEGAKIKVRTVKALIRCSSCGYHGRGTMDPEDPLKHLVACPCPRCGSLAIQIEKGRECVLKKIEALR
jgi:hydrogenase nickel incorporation protein HypA/HybF